MVTKITKVGMMVTKVNKVRLDKMITNATKVN